MNQFELKPEHLKLLKNFCVGWQDVEFGAPEIDPKRPYGNSDVEQDMIEILGFKELKRGFFKFELFGKEYLLKGSDKFNIDLENEDELLDILRRLHRETETALQICLAFQQFKTGLFVRDDDYSDWQEAKV